MTSKVLSLLIITLKYVVLCLFIYPCLDDVFEFADYIYGVWSDASHEIYLK